MCKRFCFLIIVAFLGFGSNKALANLSVNEVAHLLAGSTQVADPSPLFKKVINSKEWTSRLSTSLKYRFSPPEGPNAAQKNREALREFAEIHLASASKVSKTIFYPFGGPDAFYPFVFFPNASRVLVGALEPAGTLPEIKDESDLGLLYRGMDGLNEAYQTYFFYGYFITSEMRDRLSSQLGTAAVICASLAAQGFEISTVDAVGLNADGVLVTAEPNPAHSVKLNGVEIHFVKGDATPATYVYLRQDLSNQGVAGAFEKFITSEKADATYYKAASYISYNTRDFSLVNRLALRSRFLVQGDSGLPWNLIKSEASVINVDLFGLYTMPTKQFGTQFQTSLNQNVAAGIANSNLEISNEATKDFKRLNGYAPSSSLASRDEGYIRWMGYLPVPYDYAGMLNSHGASNKDKRKFSILIFATLSHATE